MGLQNFLIRRASAEENESLVISTPMLMHTAVMRDPTNVSAGLKSDGTGFVGFLTHKVTATGAQISDFVFPNNLTGREVDVKAGKAVSVEKAIEVEAEGADYLIGSGAMAITNTTPDSTELSFLDGRFCVKQTGQQVYALLEAQLAPETEGNTRILVRMK